jgi:ABC-type transport system involved in multi-copper enzyme maturation permease subunit
MISLLKRRNIAIVGVLLYLVYAVFLLIVPAVEHLSPFVLWSNITLSPLTFNMYVGAIFSAIVSIAIFREYRDDGTELIISSKQITRTRIIIIKFAVLITFMIGYCVLLTTLPLMTFSFSSVTNYQIMSLIASIFLANFIFTIMFATIATFISIFMNKV